MSIEVNKKMLCLAITVILMLFQSTTDSTNLFLLLSISLSAFYSCKINTIKFNKIAWGVVSFGYLSVFSLFFIKGILVMFT
ncbi:MAG: hypothetical protein ACRC3Y_10610 [Romboutsia sp.]|uniref:hypothetical protein n=1 Tax=Romboutsia sp. TaxID=1965302 RepID=UPI003F2D3C7F